MISQQKTHTARKVIAVVLCLAIPLAVGFISSAVSGDIRGIYDTLAKPPLSPPGWLFGLVWPVLYVLMGLASYLVISSDEGFATKMRALSVYLLQLIVNAMWSIVFFRGNMLWGALIVILGLDILVLATMMAFGRIRRSAGLLLVPYMAWILFATYLNAAFAWLN